MITLNLRDQLFTRIQAFVKKHKLVKPSVVSLESVEAGEYEALILFSENMRMASDGLSSILNSQSPNAYYMYTTALVLYRQMFKGSSGIKRSKSKIKLIDGKIRNADGGIKKNDKGLELKVLNDRFYIEEFYSQSKLGFKTHFDMIDQADKYLCHFDEESDKKAVALIVFEGEKAFHLLNHFEFSLFDSKILQSMYEHCINVQKLINDKLKVVAEELWFESQATTLKDHTKNQIFSPENFN